MRRTRCAGLALALALTIGGCDDGTANATLPDAATGELLLSLSVATRCLPDRAPVRPDDPELIRLRVQVLRGGGIASVDGQAVVYVEAGGNLRLDEAGNVSLQGGIASLLAECVEPGAIRIVAEVPELGLRSEPRFIRCLDAARYARECEGARTDGGAGGDGGPPPPPDAGRDAAEPFPDAAPGGPALRAEPPTESPIPAFGGRSEVRFTLVDAAEEPWAGQQVSFSLDPPSARHTLTPSVATTDPLGRINIRLDARGDIGAYRIVGGLAIDDRRIAGRSTPIEVTPGPLRAGGLSIECDAAAIAAFDADGNVAGRAPRACAVRAADPENRPIAGVDVTLLAEAGRVPRGVGPTGAEGTAAFEYESGGGPPVSVAPNPVPANGQATILAVASGQEGFEDANGDGVYVADDDHFDGARHDLPEPFVDANDDGQRGPDEAFVDVDGDGRYSAGNGEWDTEAPVSATFGVLWVGPHDADRSHAELDCSAGGCQANPACGTPFGAHEGGSAHVRFTVADRNGNCVHTHRDDTWTLRWPGAVGVTGPLGDACRDAQGRPAAVPQRVEAPGLSSRQGADRIPLTLTVDYDSVLGRRRFETPFDLCVIP